MAGNLIPKVAFVDHKPSNERKSPTRTLAAAALALTLAACSLVAETTRSPSAPTPGGATQPQWITSQPGAIRVDKLIGTAVKDDAGEHIVDIKQIVLSKDNKVAAVVVGVGGFLGIGEHDVAVSFDSIRLTDDANNNTVVTMSATKDALKAAPQWHGGANATGITRKGTPPADKSTK